MAKMLALAVLVALVALTATTAVANPREPNGRISYDRSDNFVFTANPDGSFEQLIGSPTCCAGWSPDGTRLAIGRGTDDDRIGTAIVRADGSDYTPLPLDDPTLNIGCGTGSWSPDGTTLTCEAWDDATPARNGMYTVSATDGTILRRVTSAPDGDHDIPGSYSPNGKRIVFVRQGPDGNVSGLFVVNADGRKLRQITSAGTLVSIAPDWSPQGNDIAFSRRTPDARGSLWVVHFNGADLRQIHVQGLACGGPVDDPDSIGCHAPRWSPDGSKLIFATNTHNIFTANLDGSALTQVTYTGDADHPDWGTHPLAP